MRSPNPAGRNRSSPTALPAWLKLLRTRVSTSCGESAGNTGRMRIGELLLPPQREREFLIREIAGVDDAGQSQAVRVRVQIGGAAQPVLWGLCSLERREGGLRRRHDACRVIDHHPSGGEERAADAVRDRAGAAARARDVDAVLRRSRVQLRLRRPSILGELRVVPAADAGDEGAWRDRRRALRDRLLQLGDRECAFDAARLVAGVDAGSRVVHVRIEQTGNDGASSQVDRARRGAERPRLADADDAAVLDRQRRSRPGRGHRRIVRW